MNKNDGEEKTHLLARKKKDERKSKVWIIQSCEMWKFNEHIVWFT